MPIRGRPTGPSAALGKVHTQTGQGLNLPDQSGLQMLALARQDGLVATAQVVVLSADVMPETRRAAREAGVTQFLDKPFRLSDLKRVLGQAALAAAQ